MRFIAGHKVTIGDEAEIFRGSTLDGRSKCHEALTIGPRCRLKENVWLACYGGKIALGEEVFVSRNVVMEGHGNIFIDDFCSFGPNVVIVSHRQVIEGNKRYHQEGYIRQPVHIGKDCHIASGTVIASGVVIGARTYVGANSVVTHDLPEGAFCAGTPAKRLGDFERPAAPGEVTYHEDWH